MSRELEPIVTAEDKRINRASTVVAMMILAAGFMVACGEQISGHKDSDPNTTVKEQPHMEHDRNPATP